jgi:hypothetical protein
VCVWGGVTKQAALLAGPFRYRYMDPRHHPHVPIKPQQAAHQGRQQVGWSGARCLLAG